MAGVLDSARFRYFLAEEFKVSVEDVTAFVLGGHGDTMVPLTRYSTDRRHSAAGPREDGLDQPRETRPDRAAHARWRRRNRRTCSRPARRSTRRPKARSLMAKSYLRDKRRLLPCAANLNGEYGLNDMYVGVPCIIGKDGVEKVVEIELSAEERADVR